MTTPDRPGVVNCLATVTELKFLGTATHTVAAARTARRLGATPLDMKIAADLASFGEPVERRLGSREALRLVGRGLTPRELEVIRQVAHGLTSREIGQGAGRDLLPGAL